MDGTVIVALVSLLGSVALGVLGVLGRRFEGRETRAVTTQGEVIDDLVESNKRLRMERDEARAAVDEVIAAHKVTSRELFDAQHPGLGIGRRP